MTLASPRRVMVSQCGQQDEWPLVCEMTGLASSGQCGALFRAQGGASRGHNERFCSTFRDGLLPGPSCPRRS